MCFIKSCCGFGHKEINEDINDKLYYIINQLANNGCKNYYCGANGMYDEIFSSAVSNIKKSFPNIRLIYVKTHFKKDFYKYGNFLYNLYDEMIIPTELTDINYKLAIKNRNQWMIEQCDFIIGYIKHNYGSAFDAIKYAKEKGKAIYFI